MGSHRCNGVIKSNHTATSTEAAARQTRQTAVGAIPVILSDCYSFIYRSVPWVIAHELPARQYHYSRFFVPAAFISERDCTLVIPGLSLTVEENSHVAIIHLYQPDSVVDELRSRTANFK